MHDWFRLGQDRYIGECITTFEAWTSSDNISDLTLLGCSVF